jgi:RDD family/Protein of unknown function (DUF2510)
VTPDQDGPDSTPALPLPPSGWYPDPSSQAQLRWWDGHIWSVHVAGAPVQAAPYGPEVQIAGHRAVLAGWGRRAGGYLIDNLILLFPILILNIVVGLTLKSNSSNYELFGTSNHVSLTVVVILDIVGAALRIGYSAWMLRWRSQTVGMIAVDAVMVDQRGAAKLTWAQIWKRVLFVQILRGPAPHRRHHLPKHGACVRSSGDLAVVLRGHDAALVLVASGKPAQSDAAGQVRRHVGGQDPLRVSVRSTSWPSPTTRRGRRSTVSVGAAASRSRS